MSSNFSSTGIKSATTRPSRQVFAVAELNRKARQLLETHFSTVWVQGEISNFARPQSGHWYFTLKDSSAQVRCAMFRNKNNRLRFQPKEGDEVIARGRISLYEGRGDYQLIVENLEPAGAGALQQQFEQLKKRLQQEGLFTSERKIDLPTYPEHIVVITSATGAALRDIISVFKRRAPHILLSVYPVVVQGQESAGQIVSAITHLNRQHGALSTPVDAIILARGGGSLEDLWSFNEEIVARAIDNSTLPIVSAVGHETDITISDMVADYRAPTPSAAAEVLSPDMAGIKNQLEQYKGRLINTAGMRLSRANQALAQTARLLRHPGQRLEEHNQRCDELADRLQRSTTLVLANKGLHFQHQADRLINQAPSAKIVLSAKMLDGLSQRLRPAMQQRLQQVTAAFLQQTRVLETVSPLATLDRGYSILKDEGGAIIRDANRLQPGDLIEATLSNGKIQAAVTRSES